MWSFPKRYQVIVVGAGHAGCEAAYVCARRGFSTLLITTNLDTIGKLSCNPAMGGIGKGHLIREVDALGGLIGHLTDQSAIQCRMLNQSKGAAVQAPRAQVDRIFYQNKMKQTLEAVPHLSLFQASIEEIIVQEGVVCGVLTREKIFFGSDAVILCSGTFLEGKIHIGDQTHAGGRAGDPGIYGLSKNLKELGFHLDRLKTGTPPRIHADSIDYTKLEEQAGQADIFFSHKKATRLPQVSCWIGYTNANTHAIAQQHLQRSALYSGNISGIGPRYCPSFEDKIVKFADKSRHQIFLEPEGLTTKEIYVNGLSTSFPFDVQVDLIHSIEGLENAHITRAAYAIEYDYLPSGQLSLALETHLVKGLFCAGQINGTTGYEEAAAQGLIAGINACCYVNQEPYLYLQRHEAYIGVMLYDLTTKTLQEPYRMFTSRAEWRLLLGHYNAAYRLKDHAYRLNLISEKRYQQLQQEEEFIHSELQRLKKTFAHHEGESVSIAQLIKRPEHTYSSLKAQHHLPHLDPHIEEIVSYELKYEGYLIRQKQEISKIKKYEEHLLPANLRFDTITGLSKEASSMLSRFKPSTVGQAMRIQGVCAADIQVLIIHLEKHGS